jgi:hypothetical protein
VVSAGWNDIRLDTLVVAYKGANIPTPMDTRTFPMSKWMNSAREVPHRAVLTNFTLAYCQWDGVVTADFKYEVSFWNGGEWKVLAK